MALIGIVLFALGGAVLAGSAIELGRLLITAGLWVAGAVLLALARG